MDLYIKLYFAGICLVFIFCAVMGFREILKQIKIDILSDDYSDEVWWKCRQMNVHEFKTWYFDNFHVTKKITRNGIKTKERNT
jgi:hypothetical protein